MINTSRDQKIVDAESRAEIAMKNTGTGRLIKPSAKAKDVIGTTKGSSNSGKTSPSEQSSEIEDLVVQLTNLLEAWDENNEDISVNLT